MPYELEPPDDSSQEDAEVRDSDPGGAPSEAKRGPDEPDVEPAAGPVDPPAPAPPDPVVDDAAAVRPRGAPCPSCGAALHEPGALVCLGCGWDQRALEQRATAVSEEEVEAPLGPLVAAHPSDRWLPPAIAVVALATLGVGLLMGIPGLFAPAGTTEGVPAAIGWGERMAQLGRLPVVMLVWTLCGIGSFFVLAWLEVRPLGDMRAVAVRLLAAVAAARSAEWIAIAQWPMVEFLLECVAAAAFYFVFVLALFKLRPRQAGIVLGVTVGAFFIGLFLAHLVIWAV